MRMRTHRCFCVVLAALVALVARAAAAAAKSLRAADVSRCRARSSSLEPATQSSRHQARRHQRLHAGDDDAVQGAGCEGARRPRARRSDQRDARRRIERRVSDRRSRRSARRRSRRRAAERAEPVRVVGLRAAEARRSRCPTRRSSIRTARSGDFSVVQGHDRRDDVHLHALPAADLLPADGSPLRGDSADARRRTRR